MARGSRIAARWQALLHEAGSIHGEHAAWCAFEDIADAAGRIR
jgi:hypothetical protein